MVCRRVDGTTGNVFAIKRVEPKLQLAHPFLLENEVNGLTHANYRKIPRVVIFEALIVLQGGDARIFLE